jgi:hypothetical protein
MAVVSPAQHVSAAHPFAAPVEPTPTPATEDTNNNEGGDTGSTDDGFSMALATAPVPTPPIPTSEAAANYQEIKEHVLGGRPRPAFGKKPSQGS